MPKPSEPMDDTIERLQLELAALKQTLASKAAASSILCRDLEQCRKDRDEFRIMLEDLRNPANSKEGVAASWNIHQLPGSVTLSHQLQLSRRRCQQLDEQVAELTHRLDEMSIDMKLLRETARASCDCTCVASASTTAVVGGASIVVSPLCDINGARRHTARRRSDEQAVSAADHALLLQQLEQKQLECAALRREAAQVASERDDLQTDIQTLRAKCHRLNHQLNAALQHNNNNSNNNDANINSAGERAVQLPGLDIDCIIGENRHLKPMLLMAEQEIRRLTKVNYRYKRALEGGERCVSGGVSGDIIEQFLANPKGPSTVFTKRQVTELLHSGSLTSATAGGGAVIDPGQCALRSLCVAVMEQLDDKCTALAHQRKTCRLLAEHNQHLRERLQQNGLCTDPADTLMSGYTSPDVARACSTDTTTHAHTHSPSACHTDKLISADQPAVGGAGGDA